MASAVATAADGDVALVVIARHAVLASSVTGIDDCHATGQGTVGPVEIRVGQTGVILEVQHTIQREIELSMHMHRVTGSWLNIHVLLVPCPCILNSSICLPPHLHQH